MIEFILGCAAGWFITYLWHLGTDHTPRRYDVHVSKATTLHLQYLGKLDERRFKSLCYWVTDGRPFRLLALTNAKVLTRSQFEEVRSELVARRLAIQNPNKTVDITPPGRAFFRWGAGRHKRANDNQMRK
jgi:hypothetical protein